MRFNFAGESPNTTAAAASFLILLLPLAARVLKSRSWEYLCAGAILTLVVVTQSRSGLIGLIFAFCVLYRNLGFACYKRNSPKVITVVISSIAAFALLCVTLGFHNRWTPDSLVESASLRFKMVQLCLMRCAEIHLSRMRSPNGLAEDGFLRFGMEFVPLQLSLLKSPLGSLWDLLLFPWWIMLALAALIMTLLHFSLSSAEISSESNSFRRALGATATMFLTIACFNNLRQDRLGAILCIIAVIAGLACALRILFTPGGIRILLLQAAAGTLCAVGAVFVGRVLLHFKDQAGRLTYSPLQGLNGSIIDPGHLLPTATLVLFDDLADTETKYLLRRSAFAMIKNGWRVIEVRGYGDWSPALDHNLRGDRVVFARFGGSERKIQSTIAAASSMLIIGPRPIDYYLPEFLYGNSTVFAHPEHEPPPHNPPVKSTVLLTIEQALGESGLRLN